MDQLVADLFDLTRLRFGMGLVIDRKPGDLATMSSEIVDELRAVEPDYRFLVDVRGNLSGSWDIARIGQLVSNLLGNAVQHGQPHGVISLTARGERDAVVLSVHSEGAAIEPDQLAMIFEPFQYGRSVDERGTGAPGSLGLGLYIARAIAQAHGGDIRVDSTSKGGTTFSAWLRRAP